MLFFTLAFNVGNSVQSQETDFSPQVREQLEAAIARQKARIEKESTSCANKLDIPVPTNTEELVARYGLEKARAFNECMIDESGVFWSMGRALWEHKRER
jgi:hypothetical protein